jgi:hypothetical protein|nr:MAG TPA: hypothetical protein [Caudoviricetes sp.]
MALVHSLSPIFSMKDEIFLLKYLYRGGIINFAGVKRLSTIYEKQTSMVIRLISCAIISALINVYSF